MVFSYRPFLVTIINSFHTVSIMGERLNFVGFENYSRLFASQSFQDSLSNTLRFTLFFVPANMFLCLSAALLANRKGRLATLNQVFFFLPPLAVGLSSSMMIFKMIFNPSLGIVNHLLGAGIQWFNNPPKAAMALLVIAGGVYLDFGFNFLLFHAALRNVPPKDLIEVAQIEGASPFQTFRYLIFPLIGPTVVFVLITNIKDAMLISSPPVLILTEGGALPFHTDAGLPDVS